MGVLCPAITEYRLHNRYDKHGRHKRLMDNQPTAYIL